MQTEQQYRWAQWYNDILYRHRKDWLWFLKWWFDDRYEFIRETLTMGRHITESVDQMHKQMLFFLDPKKCTTRPDWSLVHMYSTVYEFMSKEWNGARWAPDFNTAKINRAMLDFDSEDDLAAAYNDAKEAVARAKKFDYDSRVVFTGGRGFQVHILFHLPKTRAELVTFTQGIVRELDGDVCFGTQSALKTCDMSTSCTGDVARHCRLPYTLHARTFRQALLVNLDEQLVDIVARSEELNVPRIP